MVNEAGITISRLDTVTDLPGKDGGRGFEITAQLTVPVGVDLDAVLDSIGEVTVRLGIALNVEDLTGDTRTISWQGRRSLAVGSRIAGDAVLG